MADEVKKPDDVTPPKPEAKAAPAPVAPAPLDVSEKHYDEIRRKIKALAVRREKLVNDHAAQDAIEKVLAETRELAAEGSYVARELQARAEAKARRDARLAAIDQETP